MDLWMSLFWFSIILPSITTSLSSSPLNHFKEAGCNFHQASKDFNANFVIGALFPVHELDIRGSTYGLNVYGVTWVEAFLFAIDEINKNKTLLPGVKLGYDVRDTCNSEQVAKMHTLDFMSDPKYFGANKKISNRNECNCFDGNQSKLIGVIGGARSPVSSTCSYLLGAGNIPQISYASTSPSLSRTFLYPNLLRTIPSDLQQTLAISELLDFMKWRYVSVIASDDAYGQLAIDILQQRFKKKGICLAVEKHFNPSLPQNELDEIVNALQEVHSETQLVIVWATDYSAIKKILDAAKAKGLTQMLWAILTETWGTDLHLRYFKDFRVIQLKHDNPVVHNFVHHLANMKYQSHLDNIWIRSLWKSYGFCPEFGPADFQCYDIAPSGSFLTKTYHETVIASVYAVATGLHRILNCSKKSCIKPLEGINYKLLLDSIKESNFQVPSSDFHVQFEEYGDISSNAYYKFTLYGFKRVEFGHWNKQQGIHVDSSKFWKNYGEGSNRTIADFRATCSYPCQPGFYKVQRTKSCCWDCIKCPAGEFSSEINSTQCKKCDIVEIVSQHRNECLALTNHRLTLSSTSGLAISLVSLIGILCALGVLTSFVVYWETPVIKSANREMSIFQICCMTILFGLPITDFVTLSKATCILQSVLFSSLHSLILVLTLLKTYRLWLIFQPLFFAKYMKMFLRVPVQVFSSFLLVFILIFVLALWYNFHAPTIKLYTNRTEYGYIYHCGENEPRLLYAFVVYIFVLSLASGFIAFRARRLPANFNEAQCIWVAMFANCITWVSLLPLHLSSNKLHQPTMVFSINCISNFILLACLYGPKIRILLCSPHLNDKKHFVLSPNAKVKTYTLRLKSKDKSSEDDSTPGKKSSTTQSKEKTRVITFDFDSN